MTELRWAEQAEDGAADRGAPVCFGILPAAA